MPTKPGPLRPHEERQNYARRISEHRPPGEPSPGDSFLIATEGEVTEKLYFESVLASLQLNPVTVKVVHPRCTDAEGLVRAAMSFYEWVKYRKRMSKGPVGNRDIDFYDHVWVVFDTDIPAPGTT